MKKLIFIMIFFLFISFLIPKKDNSKMVMANINNTNYYRLIFNNENLNLGNFKLKIGLFTSYDTKITKVYGCTDINAKNYNKEANTNDGSCQYYIMGCTDTNAKNYNSQAEKNDGSCEYYKLGCMDSTAKNYDNSAEKDDGSCQYYKLGCTNINAKNYDSTAEKDDGSCISEDSGISSNDTLSGILGLGVIGCIVGVVVNKKIKNK